MDFPTGQPMGSLRTPRPTPCYESPSPRPRPHPQRHHLHFGRGSSVGKSPGSHNNQHLLGGVSGNFGSRQVAGGPCHQSPGGLRIPTHGGIGRVSHRTCEARFIPESPRRRQPDLHRQPNELLGFKDLLESLSAIRRDCRYRRARVAVFVSRHPTAVSGGAAFRPPTPEPASMARSPNGSQLPPVVQLGPFVGPSRTNRFQPTRHLPIRPSVARHTRIQCSLRGASRPTSAPCAHVCLPPARGLIPPVPGFS